MARLNALLGRQCVQQPVNVEGQKVNWLPQDIKGHKNRKLMPDIFYTRFLRTGHEENLKFLSCLFEQERSNRDISYKFQLTDGAPFRKTSEMARVKSFDCKLQIVKYNRPICLKSVQSKNNFRKLKCQIN